MNYDRIKIWNYGTKSYDDITDSCLRATSGVISLDKTPDTFSFTYYRSGAFATFQSGHRACVEYYSDANFSVLEKRIDYCFNVENLEVLQRQDGDLFLSDITFVDPIVLLQKYIVDDRTLSYNIEDVIQYLDYGKTSNLSKILNGTSYNALAEPPAVGSWGLSWTYNFWFDPSPYQTQGGSYPLVGLEQISKDIFETINGRYVYVPVYRDGDAGSMPTFPDVGLYFCVPYVPLYCEMTNWDGTKYLLQLGYKITCEIIERDTGEQISINDIYIDPHKDEIPNQEDYLWLSNRYNKNPRKIPFVKERGYGAHINEHTTFYSHDGDTVKVGGCFTTNKPYDDLVVPWHLSSQMSMYYGRPETATLEKDVGYYVREAGNKNLIVRLTYSRDYDMGTDYWFYPIEGTSGVYPDKEIHLNGLPSNCIWDYEEKGISDLEKNLSVGNLIDTNQNPIAFPKLTAEFNIYKYGTAIETPSEIQIAINAKDSGFLYKQKYNLYDYFTNCLISTGNYTREDVENNRLPITVSNETKEQLLNSIIYETINQGNDMYEIVSMIGDYIHAAPTAYFNDDGKIVIGFRKFGGETEEVLNGAEVGVYKSRSLADAISQYDCSVKNVTENLNHNFAYVCAGSKDGSNLVSADNAIIRCPRNIYHLWNMWIRKKDTSAWVSLQSGAQKRIMEYSHYLLLNNRPEYTPNMGNAIYYTKGSDIIDGLSYKRPNPEGEGEEDYSIQNLIHSLYEFRETPATEVNINDYVFKIEYSTLDDIRAQIFKPNLRKFIYDTPYNKFPQQAQFRQQLEKTVNAKSYGEMIKGELSMNGNEPMSIDYVVDGFLGLPEIGSFRTIDGRRYYLSEIQYKNYDTATEFRPIYSEDYNMLSRIISVASENRYYPIPIEGWIRSEHQIKMFCAVETTKRDSPSDIYITPSFFFLGDYRAVGTPRNEIYMIIKFYNDEGEVVIIKYANSLSFGSTKTYSVDMEDNFSAGDRTTQSAGFVYKGSYALVNAFDVIGGFKADVFAREFANVAGKYENAYNVTTPVRYCDSKGENTAFEIFLYASGHKNWTQEEIRNMPLYSDPENIPKDDLIWKTPILSQKKDARMAMSYNMQISAIETDEEIHIGSAFFLDKSDYTTKTKAWAFTEPQNHLNNKIVGGVECPVYIDYNQAKITVSFPIGSWKSVCVTYTNVDNDNELCFLHNSDFLGNTLKDYFINIFNSIDK